MGAAGADHDADHAVAAWIECTAVEHPLAEMLPILALDQRADRVRQAGAGGVAEEHRGNRCGPYCAQLRDRRHQLLRVRHAGDQIGGALRRQRQHHSVVRGIRGATEQLPPIVAPMQALDRRAQVHLRTARLQSCMRGIRQQRRQVSARQQQVTGGPIGAQAVAHHRQEHLRRGLVQSHVQGGDAQRLPDTFDQYLRQSGEQRGSRHRRRRLPMGTFPVFDRPDHRPPRGPGQPVRRQQRGSEVKRSG
jgi:hypothetical protein